MHYCNDITNFYQLQQFFKCTFAYIEIGGPFIELLLKEAILKLKKQNILSSSSLQLLSTPESEDGYIFHFAAKNNYYI